VPWLAAPTRLEDVLHQVLAHGVAGRRIAVQQPGRDIAWFEDALRAAGAEVVAIPVYRVEPVPAGAAVDRAATLAGRGELDAITCTSATAVEALSGTGALIEALRGGELPCACVGDGVAEAARRAGVRDVVTASPARLGSMVRALGERLVERARVLDVAGVELRHQGSQIAVDGKVARLTPRERRVLEAILSSEGAVVSKERLASIAWDAPVDGHTVEVAINRLRRKLGPAALALETTNRRGYRIAR
jgi:uroporphyrinogen-III synthase